MARRSNYRPEHEPREEVAPPAKDERTLTLRLVQNAYVCTKFAAKGTIFTFPWAEAQKRLAKTSGIWEAV